MKRGLRRERNGSCLRERLRQPRQHHKVSVKRDPLKPTDAKRCQAVFVLERTELTLDRGTTPLERAPTLRAVRDQRCIRDAFRQSDFGSHSPVGQRHFVAF